DVDIEVRLDTQVIPMRGCFKYLGSLIQVNGEIDDDITNCIRRDGMVVRLTILYGVECWSVKNSHVLKI
ncbi:hypothetical protein H5410_035689, partial [Solanum commersonii]